MAIRELGRDRVRVRRPGGADVGRVRGGLAVHGQVRRTGSRRACGCSSAPSAWASRASSTASRPTIGIAIVWVMLSGFFNSPSAVARQTLLQRHTPRELRGRVFSALFVMRDVIFLVGMAGAGLADIVDVRIMIILASLILCVVGVVALFVPGIGRPAAEWRRGAHGAARGAGGRRPARHRSPRGPRPWATSTSWSAASRRSRASTAPSARRSSRTPRCARSRTVPRVDHPGRKGDVRVLHPRGRGGGRHPGRRRRLSRPVDDERGRLLRRDRRPHRERRARPTSSRPSRRRSWRSRPTRCAP